MAMKRKTVFALFVVAIFVLVFFFVVEFYMGDVQVQFNSQTLNSMATPDHWHTESDLKIPLVVHHTWKRTTAPPSELVRWRKGCMKLNRDYTFVMYNDEDLLAFTRLHYKQYLPMFEHLHGVYMADMARVLLAYHFGGIYMDLDFYCHRPFKCLLKHVRTLLQQQQQQQSRLLTDTNTNSTSTSAASASVEHAPLPKDVLVVSREPLAHAVLFRNKTRVVIQDFFLSTPKHPFFLWFLNDRWDTFTKSSAYPLPSSASVGSTSGSVSGVAAGASSGSGAGGSVSSSSGGGSGGESNSTIVSASASRKLSNHTTHAHHHSHHVVDTRPAFAKGPFSYSIEKDIDRYLQYKKDKKAGVVGTASTPTTASPNGGDTISASSASGASGDDDAILELHEDLMHALIDSTNSRLHSTCAALKGKESDTGGAALGAARKEVCKDMNAGRYFKPTKHTILVHMWTHVYLGWSFVRGLYNAYTYHTVESTLPQTQECF